MWAIVKKEFKSYFFSPIGYVVIGIFLTVFSAFFYLTTIQTGTVDLGSLYYYVALYGLIIATPALTSRMFAEERKNGTEQLILTSPTSIIGVVLGKLVAALGVVAIALVVSFMYFIIVSFLGAPNIASVLVAMLGFLLISTAAISVGMFASSITENQIISIIITIAFLLLTIFLQDISGIFSYFSLINYYEKFASSLISITDVVRLVTFSAMFICFTIIVMQRRKSVK